MRSILITVDFLIVGGIAGGFIALGIGTGIGVAIGACSTRAEKGP